MKLPFIAFFLALAVATLSEASVSIEIKAGQLTDSANAFVLDGRYVTLISAGVDGVFSAPTSASYVSNDDYFVGGFGVDSTTFSNKPGSFDVVVGNLNDLFLTAPNFQPGQKLAIRWFPTIVAALATSGPGAGASYGQYADSSWVVPADGFNVGPYTMFTLSTGAPGGLPNSTGKATAMVPGAIPEPSAYALLGGLAVLGLAAVRRRRS